MRWVWRLLQRNWKHSVLLRHSKTLLHPSITGQMFSEALSFIPQVGPIPLKINSLPIPLASTTKPLMKANWIVCRLYDQAIKPRSVFSENKRCCCWRMITWDHLHAVTPLNPAIRPQSFPILRTSIHSARCIKTLRGTISLNKHQNLLPLWLISFLNSSWVIRRKARSEASVAAIHCEEVWQLAYIHHVSKTINHVVYQ